MSYLSFISALRVIDSLHSCFFLFSSNDLSVTFINFQDVTSARYVGGGGGGSATLVPLDPQVCIDPENIVKISQKYIADPPPLWLSHESSTGCDTLPLKTY